MNILYVKLQEVCEGFVHMLQPIIAHPVLAPEVVVKEFLVQTQNI